MTIDDLRILRGLSMTKLCEAAGLSMGAVFKLTRPGAELERVALLAEGVDRNSAKHIVRDPEKVALLAEGVDRNMPTAAKYRRAARRPPRGGRG